MRLNHFVITGIYGMLVAMTVNNDKTHTHIYSTETGMIARIPRTSLPDLVQIPEENWEPNGIINKDELAWAIKLFKKGYQQGQKEHSIVNPNYPENKHELNGFFAGRMNPLLEK